jgi:hypothetical protein
MRKVVLTESQFKAVRQIESASQVLEESLRTSRKIDNLKTTVKKLLYAGVAATAIIAAINKQDILQSDKDVLIQTVLNGGKSAEEIRLAAERDSIYNAKVKAVDEYMKYALDNQGFSKQSTRLDAETLVKACDSNGFDLPFVMAAAHLESCFGATRRAQLTNSVFSEGCWDNGKNKVRYSDPNESVYGYINLLKRSYLVNGKTIKDLMVPGKFVNGLGKRYASDKNYERKLKNVRNRIISMYPELG